MSNQEFANKAIDIANNYKTLYVMGGWGQPLNDNNKLILINKNAYNKKIADNINKATSDTFAFDCVCLIKSILWGFNGDVNKTRGGAIYASNGVKDVNADTMMTKKYCTDLSSNFSKLEVGELVGMTGHIGIYVGDNKVVEATSAWEGKVLISTLDNKGRRIKNGKQIGNWTLHGKSIYLDYKTKSILDLANEVILGKWGNGLDRKNKLTNAGYNYNEVQTKVNELLNNTYIVKKGDTLYKIAKEMYGDGNKYSIIALANNIKNANIINIGQVLKIPK